MTTTTKAAQDTAVERHRQDEKWGEQNHPDGTGPQTQPLGYLPYRPAFFDSPTLTGATAEVLAAAFTEVTNVAARQGYVTWADILLEEVFEALAEDAPELLRAELIQIAAVAQQWAEAIDRRDI